MVGGEQSLRSLSISIISYGLVLGRGSPRAPALLVLVFKFEPELAGKGQLPGVNYISPSTIITIPHRYQETKGLPGAKAVGRSGGQPHGGEDETRNSIG